jgi:hypothetical protein
LDIVLVPSQLYLHNIVAIFSLLTETMAGYVKFESRECANGEKDDQRLVVVKYFLDRPGYGLDNSSARLWKDAPKKCTVAHIRTFLLEQGIWEDDHILVEVYLDTYKTYMVVEAMEKGGVVFDYSDTSCSKPGVLNIRLTDLHSGEGVAQRQQNVAGDTSYCTLSPVGLFAFSMTVIMETADLYGELLPGSVSPSLILYWYVPLQGKGASSRQVVISYRTFDSHIQLKLSGVPTRFSSRVFCSSLRVW